MSASTIYSKSPDSGFPKAPQFSQVALIYDDLMDCISYDIWLRYLKVLWGRRKVVPMSVLDVACGTGNMSFRIADQGIRVVGIDYSPAMIEAARSKLSGGRRGLDIEFHCQDASEISIPETFDAAISLFDSLNYILDYDRLKDAFRRVYSYLNLGGLFIFDMNTEYALSHGFFDQDNLDSPHYPRYEWKSVWNPQTRMCTIEMDFEYLGSTVVERFHETHYQRGYSLDELKEGLQQAGFADIEFLHAFSLRPPRKKTDRVYVLAAKSY